jgi:hypothetical protein
METIIFRVEMIPNPTLTTVMLLILSAIMSIVVMLLPAFYELRKPSDAGPRRIMKESLMLPLRTVKPFLIADVEEDYRIGQTTLHRILDIVAVLPNLEA